MWNPKRILLLVAGFAVFFGVYLVYARFLGGIDGLPPLPQALWPGPRDDKMNVGLPQRRENAIRQLQKAFGEDCPEVKRSIRLEVAAHNLVLAASDFALEDGRVKLWPFSMAIFGKEKPGTNWHEINTVRADVAYLTFDRPVNNVMEIGSRRIIGGELSQDPKKLGGAAGGVTIVNNRGTERRDDDVSIFSPGPIHYQENQHRAWTDNVVLLTDLQSRPKPTTINAVGMDVFLLAENKAAAAKPPAGKSRMAGVTGVERILLRSDVNMHLWIDSRSGFLGGGNATRKPEPVKSDPTKEPERVQVVITTQGPFSYDLRTDRATFDVAPKPGPGRNHVVVNRINEAEDKREQLMCDALELLFHRRGAKDAPKASANRTNDQAVDLEIRSARATAKKPGGLTITSDTENLEALGSELTYDAEARLTVLKGSPDMVAIKDGNKIHARELRMKMGEKTVQEVTAPGPGRIALLDRANGLRHQHARWQDELIATREGNVDILLLTGQALFEDEQQGQRIEADRLKVWLEPGPGDARKPAGKSDTEREAQRRRPQRLEARGHVKALAPDLRVKETELLVIRFADAPPSHGPPAPSAQGLLFSGPANPVPPPAGPSGAQTPAAPSLTKDVPKKPAKPKNPLDVSAQFMEAYVLRSEARNELDKLVCRGSVHVRQEPATADDKEVDIRGETLELTRHAEGDVLVVVGKTSQTALIKLDKMTILGPVVTIDQKTNRATVEGTGAMTMPSNTSFDGGKLEKTTMLTVYWDKSMFFDGKFAEFHGGIQALQDKARMACQTMQVYLDREVSFRENAKGGEAPKVHKLVCDAGVRVEDRTEENGRLTSHKIISAKELALDQQDGRVLAAGPGWVRILQLGARGELFPTAPGGVRPPAGAPAKPAAKEDMELKLTRVEYGTGGRGGRMLADNTTKTVMFFDDIEVVHLPAKDVNIQINPNRLPPEAVHLQCKSLLKILSIRQPNGKTLQEMQAFDRVIVSAQDFWGFADVVKYSEENDQLIFEAKEGNWATLHRAKVQGGEFEAIKGKKITYWRQTRAHKVEGAVDVRSSH